MSDETFLRPDHRAILKWIPETSSVLDLGCGDGDLLKVLVDQKKVRAQGIEINDESIFQCVAKGLSVFHGDIDSGLAEFRDDAFDTVILNQSLQQIKHADSVLNDALRVGRKVIVGFPNFAHIRARSQLFFLGKTPVTQSLPYYWYNTPNLHFFTIEDFIEYCVSKKIMIEECAYLADRAKIFFLPNLFAETGIFLISRK